MASNLSIRRALSSDGEAIAQIHREVVAAGDAYAWTSEASDEDDARAFWDVSGAVYVAMWDGRVAGAYRIRANQPGRGAHVANAAYMVAARDRGRGIGEAMGVHSLAEARALGYAAMQFNFVVSTNEPAIALWSKLGFTIVGRVPAAFRHAGAGLVDALVMHRFLDDGAGSGEPSAAAGPAIRTARTQDAPAIARLSTQLGYPQSGDAAARALRAIRLESSGEVLVFVNEGGEVVGWIHVLLAPRLESGTFAEIGGLVVDEAARGVGIGGRLVQAAESWAGAHGSPTIRVRSNIIREEAHRFYAARGYELAKTQAVFVKNLAPRAR